MVKNYFNKIVHLNHYNKNIKFFLMYTIIFLLFIISFLTITLYSQTPFNYVLIAFAVLESLLIFLYCFLFGRFVFDIYQFLMVLFCLCQLVSFFVNGMPHITRTPFLLAAFGIVLSEFYSQDNIPKKIIIYSFACALYLFLFSFSIIEFNGIIHPNFSARIGTFFGNQNDVARYLVIVYLFSFGQLFNLNLKKHINLLFIIPCIISFYYILLTGSISSLFMLFLISIIYLYIKIPKKYRIFFFIFIFILFTMTIFILNLPSFSYFKKRIDGIFAFIFSFNNADNSTSERFRAALNGILLFLENPLFGLGEQAIYRYSYIKTTHNNFVDLLCNYGFFAFLIYESLILFPIFTIFKRRKKNVDSFILILIFSFLFQFFLYSYNFKADMILIPLCYLTLDTNFDSFKLLNNFGFNEENLIMRMQYSKNYYKINL